MELVYNYQGEARVTIRKTNFLIGLLCHSSQERSRQEVNILVSKICVVCSQEFQAWQKPSKPARQTCSSKCAINLREKNKSGTWVQCSNCGNSVFRIPSHLKKSHKHFCNMECRDAYIAIRERQCIVCNKLYRPIRSKQKLCSSICAAEYQKVIKLSRSLVYCNYCKKEIMRQVQRVKQQKRHYCSRQCWRTDVAIKPKTCPECEIVFTPTLDKWLRGNRKVYCSKECANKGIPKKLIGKTVGKAHANWQGGKSFYRNNYRGVTWKRIAKQVRKRDGYKCLRCGIDEEFLGKTLDVHHKVPFHNFTDSKEANRLTNLVSLCPSCHLIEERQILFKQLPLRMKLKKKKKDELEALI